MILNNIGWLGMITTGQWHIECPVSQVLDANAFDPTHSTGKQGIVSFHVHEHGNSGDVTKASDDIGMEGEEATQEGVICRHTLCELKQFLYERIHEGVSVPWLFWSGYDTNTHNVVLLEALVRREIIIENEEDPRGMLPLLEWSEAVGGEAERDITMIREVIMG